MQKRTMTAAMTAVAATVQGQVAVATSVQVSTMRATKKMQLNEPRGSGEEDSVGLGQFLIVK